MFTWANTGVPTACIQLYSEAWFWHLKSLAQLFDCYLAVTSLAFKPYFVSPTVAKKGTNWAALAQMPTQTLNGLDMGMLDGNWRHETLSWKTWLHANKGRQNRHTI